MTNVAVIGSGVTGITAAYWLARKGYNVTVYEQASENATKCSFANGGQLSVSNSETWTTWSNVFKGVKWMFQKDAPLYINPKFELQKVKWLSKFLWNTASGKYQENTSKTIQLGLHSRELMQQVTKEENLVYDYSACGIVHVYNNLSAWANAAVEDAHELYTDHEVEWETVLMHQMKKLDIGLSPLIEDDVIGGIWTPSDSVGDINMFCNQLADVCKSKYNVKFIYNTKATVEICATSGVIVDNTFFKAVVVAAAHATQTIANSLGDSMNIYPVKGYSITVPIKPGQLAPTVSICDDARKIVVSRLGDRLRVAGTAELAGDDDTINPARIKPLVDWVNRYYPELDTNARTEWACLRPMTPDMLPVPSKSKHKNIYYHSGHGHLGWTLSMGTASNLAELIAHELKGLK